MNENAKRKIPIMMLVTLFSITVVSGIATYLNPAIQSYIEAFPEVSTSTIRMVSSLPSLIAMIVMLFIGPVAGIKIRYKPLVLIGLAFVTVGGLLPFFLTSNWTLILACRAILGVGVGILGIKNALIIKSSPADKSSAYLGYSAVTFNVVNSIASPLVGALADKKWNYSFLIHLVAILVVILVIFFFKEPEEVKTTASSEGKKKEKVKVDGQVYVIMAIIFVMTGTLYSLLTGMSTYLTNKGIGNAAMAGTMLSLYTIGGAVGNLFLGKIHAKMLKKTLPLTAALVVIGQAAVLYIPNIIVISIACLIAGCGYMVGMYTCIKLSSSVSEPKSIATATLFVQAAIQAGVFLHSYIIEIFHTVFRMSTNVESAFLGTIVVYVVILIFTSLYKFRFYEKEA